MNDNKSIKDRFLDNYDIILSLSIATIVVLINILSGVLTNFTIDHNKLINISISAILAILVFLSIGVLKERKSRKKTNDLLELNIPEANSFIFRKRFIQEVKDIIESSETEIICQMRSGSILTQLFQEFKTAIENGRLIKVLVCENSDELKNTLSLFSFRDIDEAGIAIKLSNRDSAIKELKELGQEKFQIKQIAYHPSNLKYISDPKLEKGKSFIIPISFQGSSRNAPSIKTYKNKDRTVFDYYYNEFERYWNHPETTEYKIKND